MKQHGRHQGAVSPTPIGLMAITPAPMTRAEAADLVARARARANHQAAIERVHQHQPRRDRAAEIAEGRRWMELRAKERAVEVRSRPPSVAKRSRRGRGRAGEPSALSLRARAIIKRTKKSQAADLIPLWLLPTRPR